MLLVNNGTNPLLHGVYELAKGASADIPDEIAKLWLDIPGVTKFIGEADIKKAKQEAEAKAKAEIEAEKARADAAEKAKQKAEAENAKLQAELAKLKNAGKNNK